MMGREYKHRELSIRAFIVYIWLGLAGSLVTFRPLEQEVVPSMKDAATSKGKSEFRIWIVSGLLGLKKYKKTTSYVSNKDHWLTSVSEGRQAVYELRVCTSPCDIRNLSMDSRDPAYYPDLLRMLNKKKCLNYKAVSVGGGNAGRRRGAILLWATWAGWVQLNVTACFER